MTFDSLPDLLLLSVLAGGVMPFVAALAQRPGAERWNRLVRVALAVLAGAGVTWQACPGLDAACLATSLAAIVATAESTYRAWTQPAVDRLTAATSPKR